jgi:hypothetical protein
MKDELWGQYSWNGSPMATQKKFRNLCDTKRINNNNQGIL